MVTKERIFDKPERSERGLKTKPIPDPRPTKPLYSIDITNTGYMIANKSQTLQELKKLFSGMTNKDKKKLIVINVSSLSSHEMLTKLLDLCMEKDIHHLNVINVSK